MNIIIPLCGTGKRFQDANYELPKPLIDVFDKKMIEHVLDSLDIISDDKIFIIYHISLDTHDFYTLIQTRYPYITLIPIYKRTDGAAETILYGIQYIIQHNININIQTLLIDCDTLYHIPILNKFRQISTSATLCFEDNESNPIYSYVRVEEDHIVEIKEKDKISVYANTGAYFFKNIHELHHHCQQIIEKDVRYKNEYYISCVIQHIDRKSVV